MNNVEMDVLIEEVMNALQAMQLSESTLHDYKHKSLAPIRNYHAKKGALYFSETLATEIVELQQARFEAGIISGRHLRNIKKGARILNEFYHTGKLLWRAPGRMTVPSNQYFRQMYESFLTHLSDSLAEGSIKGIRSTIADFLCYLENSSKNDFYETSIGDIRAYLIKVSKKNRTV